MEWIDNFTRFKSSLSPLDMAIKFFPNFNSKEMDQIICYAQVMREMAIQCELKNQNQSENENENERFVSGGSL